ncbi:MAG TPA: GAF domain-containing sensor histidine kinase [Candidatus Andersenbacteria bacterium]|nr:GAF domain-containing sensor histidine kinase [Candidatus Andersenbacteria bacterium]
MTAAAMPPMFFKKPDKAPKIRRKRRSLSQHVRTIKQAPGKIRDRVTQELYKRNAELAVRNKTLALLRKLDEISLAAEKREKMAQQMVDAIAKELSYEVVTIAIVEEKEKVWRCVAVGSNNEQLAQEFRNVCITLPQIPLVDTPDIVSVVQEGKQIYSDNLKAVHPPQLVASIEATNSKNGTSGAKHSMVLPLRFGEHTLGVLTFSSSRSFKDASRYEYESLSGIIGLISLALYKAKLYEDLQQTSAELLAANNQLKDLDKAKSEFLSIASHQLYTPLTALRGYISMIMEGDYGPISDEQKPILDILNKSALRLIELIKDLLDVSRIESGRMELHLESIDLVDIAKGLVTDLLPNAVSKKLDLQFHEPTESIPHVVVDSQRIRQVMLNFIDNSIKYTNEGKVEVSVTLKNGKVVFAVKDTGRGIAPEERDKLFKKFSRVGGSARFNTAGTGLGLYVAKQIIHEHRGEVNVESPGEGKGSTFSMELPPEGDPNSLKVGEIATVVIKAADANGQVST